MANWAIDYDKPYAVIFMHGVTVTLRSALLNFALLCHVSPPSSISEKSGKSCRLFLHFH